MLALKYKDPSILLFLSLTYPTSLLSWLRIVALFNRLQFIKRLLELHFQPRNSHTSLQFKQSFILKFPDKICLENISFVCKSLNNLSPSVFKMWFSFSSDQHNYETSSST